MAARNINVVFGLLTIAGKSDVATVTTPSLAYLCVGQPGHPEHDPIPRTAPYTCSACGPITDNEVLKRGVKSGSTYTLVDAEEAAEAKAEYGKAYKGTLNVVPHPAQEFLTSTGEGKTLHYIVPAEASAAGHYQLMVKLITDHPELAFAGLYTPMSATSLYHLTVREGVLVLAQRTREQNMKPVPSVGGEVNDGLYAMLEGALDSFVTAYDPAAYESEYEAKLTELIEAGETISLSGDAKPEALRSIASDEDLMAQLAALQKKRPAKKAVARKKVSA